MFQTITRLGVACALTLAVSAIASAQSAPANANAEQKKEKRRPADLREADQPASTPTATSVERAVDNLPIEVVGGRTVVAHLDESFMEAMTATQQEDGTLRFDHIIGSREAAAFVEQQSATPSGVLPARRLPLAYPMYEVK